MHRADLPYFPANSNQLVKRRLINQIAGVMLAIPADVRNQRFGGHRRLFEEGKKLPSVTEGSLRKLVQLGDEILYGKLPGSGLRGHWITSHAFQYKTPARV